MRVTEGRIDYDASTEVSDVIASIKRTEDIKLSPDNSRLAIVDFVYNRIFLFSIRIQLLDDSAGSPKIEIRDYSIITSDSFAQPHGVVFLGNDNLIVCNRAAGVDLFKIPAPGQHPRERKLRPHKTIRGKGWLSVKVKTPGSVDCYPLDADRYRLLVCNNHWHFVSSHIVKPCDAIRIKNEGVLIQNGLLIPDGISISHNGAWIAISNHVDGQILIYENTSDLDKQTKPAAVLKGTVCPHGVRFAPDGKLLVADAASPYLHVYDCHSGNWRSGYKAQTIQILDTETFYDGRYDSREGGLKGLDVDKTGRVLLSTHRYGVLQFYDMKRLLSRQDAIDSAQHMALCRQRDESLARQKRDVLHRQWNFKSRANHILRKLPVKLKQYGQFTRIRFNMFKLYLRNRWSREAVTDPAGPVLSMTTHGDRLELVFYALESIACGSKKPSRLILWLTDEKPYNNPPKTLQRLAARGLEIRYHEDLGPHTKYYAYITGDNDPSTLVTADDDTLYSRGWMKQLVEAHEADTSAIHCFRAHRIQLSNGRLAPYKEWQPCEGRKPSYLNFITGVSGVIYPPEYLKFLKQQGRAFTRSCPYGDDIWLSVNALRGGFKVAQVENKQHIFPSVPGSQKQRLFDINVVAGLNQAQLRNTYTESDLLALRECTDMS